MLPEADELSAAIRPWHPNLRPAFLVVAWRRVRTNKDARTIGVDRVTPCSLLPRAEELLVGLRDDLKALRFVPQWPVRDHP